jgi:tripartite-type tricarboxylate transporter receptor subunit TctC
MSSTLKALLLSFAVFAASPFAGAQAFPNKPVRLIVGSAAGSTPDVIARHVAQKLSESWGGNAVIVDNRSGAAGTLAADAVAKSAPDGHTLLLSDNSTWGINPHLFAKLPYDPLKDLVPVVQVGALPVFLVVHESVPVTTLGELIAYAKKHPGKLLYGSAGTGSIHHLTGEMFRAMTGADIVHVPYKGAAQIGTALLAGEVQMAFMGYTGAAPAIAQGKAKAIAVASEQRAPGHPNTPTMNEAGIAGFFMSANVGLNAPAGTPQSVIDRISASVAEAVRAPDVASKLSGLGIVTTTASSPRQFAQVVRADYDKFGNLVKQSGAKVE